MILDYIKAFFIFKRPPKREAFLDRARWIPLFIVFSSLFPTPGLQAKSPPKELPLSVSIQSLVKEEAKYDGRRIVVAGRIQSIFMKRGRLGMPFLEIHLVEDGAANISENPTVTVISLKVQRVRPGDKILVQGAYHISGKKAGRFLEHYIDAEIIVPDHS